ncbi:MAG: hemolysin III family protein [Actinomycetota bacterium]|nr:hemolysin III family protein [Actinomycetota bacterium]
MSGPALARPRLRGASHVVAVPVAAGACLALAVRARTGAQLAAAVAYGITMVVMFAVSAAYHRGQWSAPIRRRLKAVDHTTIFCFVVGSYAPLAVLVLGPLGRLLFLGSLAAVVVLGIVIKLRTLDRPGGPADVLYAIAAWWGLLIVGPALRVLSPVDLALALAGLLFYSLSGGCLAGRWYDPAPRTFGYHEVAHALALAGTACHYALYWRGYR